MAHSESDRPDLDDETVTTARTTDYGVELDVDGLPDGTVAIDYFDDEPRVLIRGDDVEVDDVSGMNEETVIAVSADTEEDA